ncbi:MAG: SO2930 family diheme c-type cytochrome [Bacteroidia bacterium]|nr:SO2930 family diheme c-type cytochrome [Bacteroidia bacterium]
MLSEYGFFQGKIADQIPEKGVIPYSLPTPLFTDYAQKLRFVKLPEGKMASYNPKDVLDFPEGTVLIKTFFYYHDERNPEKGRRLMETRLLIRGENEWEAFPYHWNEEQTDATLEVAGDTKTVKWINRKGKKISLEYAMPNLNQCKGCHNTDGKLVPIGPSARQLNHPLEKDRGIEIANQLVYWSENNILLGLPEDASEIPQIAVWDNPASGTEDERARAWLDINCAHCHNPKGPANTSGLLLDIYQKDSHLWGVFKAPVAAGRGSGGHQYDIDPGNPESSILYYRLASTDPGIMMPELGRKMIPTEAAELIYDWIKNMKSEDYK